jgi:TniQ
MALNTLPLWRTHVTHIRPRCPTSYPNRSVPPTGPVRDVEARMTSLAPSGTLIDGARTLPIRIAPAEGEALDSWLEALAARYAIPLGDMLTRCGIEPTERTNLRLVSPTDDEVRHLSVVSGIEIESIQSMTMKRYRARTVETDRPSLLWMRRTSSRFCPHCLRESDGRWMLAWRLNWSFACQKHRCVLVDVCPACNRPQRGKPLSASRIPQPGRCPNPRNSASWPGPHHCGGYTASASARPRLRAEPHSTGGHDHRASQARATSA